MNKLRNFIYEKNDLIVALLVVLITASILWWKIDGIMEYPKKLVAVTVSDKERNTQPEEVGKTSAVEINITKKDDPKTLSEKLAAANLLTEKEEFESKLKETLNKRTLKRGKVKVEPDLRTEDLVSLVTSEK